jgi:hypothetical protein
LAVAFLLGHQPVLIGAIHMIRYILAILAVMLVADPASAQRVKDLGAFQGIRTNQLTGYGIVVGLPGTGDDNLEYTVQSMKGVASRLGLQLPSGVNPGLKNAAVVMITADLPAFAKPGQKIDITVSSMGKAKSLRGGTLILTPLQGADGQIYAMAQGNLAVGGLGAEGKDGSSVVVNIPSSGRIPEGATVERTVDTGFASSPYLTYNLAKSDFTTAQRVADAINARLGPGRAKAIDGVSVAVNVPVGADIRATDDERDRESRSRGRRGSGPRHRQRSHRHRRDQLGCAREPGRRNPRQADCPHRRNRSGSASRHRSARARPRPRRNPRSGRGGKAPDVPARTWPEAC